MLQSPFWVSLQSACLQPHWLIDGHPTILATWSTPHPLPQDGGIPWTYSLCSCSSVLFQSLFSGGTCSNLGSQILELCWEQYTYCVDCFFGHNQPALLNSFVQTCSNGLKYEIWSFRPRARLATFQASDGIPSSKFPLSLGLFQLFPVYKILDPVRYQWGLIIFDYFHFLGGIAFQLLCLKPGDREIS